MIAPTIDSVREIKFVMMRTLNASGGSYIVGDGYVFVAVKAADKFVGEYAEIVNGRTLDWHQMLPNVCEYLLALHKVMGDFGEFPDDF